MTDIGFLLIKITNDAIYDNILGTIKKFEENNTYGQTVIFNSYCEKINTLNIPIFHLSQSQFFNGSLIIFDLPSIILTNKFPNLKNRFFYGNTAPWGSSPMTRYDEWSSLYSQESLQIIASNQYLYDIYDICWKKPVGISENFSYEEIKKFV
jgi:hypothetical protein